jgi:serine/threonine protein kinase
MEWAAESAGMPSTSDSSAMPTPPPPPQSQLSTSNSSISSSTTSLADLSDTTSSNFSLLKPLGRGAFATCYLATNSADNKYVAVKHFHTPINKLDEKLEKSVQSEVESLKLLCNHINVTKYYGFFLEKSSFSLVVQYCESGTLSQLIDEHHQKNSFISEEQIWEILVQCLDALQYVHSFKIIHRDLKPENILLQGKDKRLIKLCDFGVSSLSQTMASTTIGTPYYLAPELCEGEMYGTAADMWSFGCVLYELLALERPFHGESLGMLVRNIMKNQPKELSATHYSEDIRNIVASFLILESHLRPSANIVLSWEEVNAYFQKFLLISKDLKINSENEAQNMAQEWHNKLISENEELGSCGGNSIGCNGGGFQGEQKQKSSRIKGSLRTNRELVQHSRVWRFGSGQSAPKIVETMLEYNISMVSLGGIDTVTNDTVNDDDGGGDEEENDAYNDNDGYEEWDNTSNGTLSSFALCADDNGNVYTFGSTIWESSFTSRMPRSMSDDGVSNISCGPDYCLAIDCLGRVWVWGNPNWVELGEPSDQNMFASTSTTSSSSSSDTSGAIPCMLGEFGLDTKAIRVSCGEEHLMVLDLQGNVWTCGDNSTSALGHEDMDDDLDQPKMINTLNNIVSISSGQTCCLALEKGTGKVYFWGTLSDIDSVQTPTLLKGDINDHKIIEIDAGRQHCGCITSEHLLFTWGENSRGECGLGHYDKCIEVPTLVEEFEDEGDLVRKVSCGARHTCAVTSDDCLFVWGDNTYGALGTKRGTNHNDKEFTNNCVNTPQQLRKFGRKKCKVMTVESGVHETFVITKAPNCH